MLELSGEDGFHPVDEGERGRTSEFGWRGADGPEDGGELIDPSPAAGLEFLLEASGLEASEYFSVSPFCLPIASWVGD